MKRKVLFVLAFVLALYIVPSILAPSSNYAAILAQPNTSKEFSTSTYGDESPQSITGFSETLPDDVLFYPDLFLNGTEQVAYSGNGTWANSQTKNGVYCSIGGTEQESVYFRFPDIQLEGFQYVCYNSLFEPTATLEVKDGSDYITLFTLTYTSKWNNGTYYFENMPTGDTIELRLNSTGAGAGAFVDYLALKWYYMTLADSNHYAESFTDVSDWDSNSFDTGDSYSTDGDTVSLKLHMVSNPDVKMFYTNDVSGDYQYIEIRYKYNVSTGVQPLSFRGSSLDNRAGDWLTVVSLTLTTSWTTIKAYWGGNTIECLFFYGYLTYAQSLNLQIDYIRLALADETGWQHDGSTNATITSADSDDEATTDGDIITLTSDLDGASFVVTFDTTATAASLATAYYPFLSVNCTSVSLGDGWKLEEYDGSAWASLQAAYITSSGVYRYNMASLDTYVQKLRLNLTQTASIKFDFIKAYSIANFTVTQGSVGSDEFMYVTAGVLYIQKDSTNWMNLAHDPALSVAVATYNVWNVTSSNIDPRGDAGTCFWLVTKVDGSYENNDDEWRGDFAYAGTLTDFGMTFYANVLMDISAVKFIDIHDWQLIVSVIIFFTIPLDETALNWLIIFLGLFMIPASTLYLVKGGKDGMSANKFFYFCIAFMLGWGLLLGGIYG